MLLQVLKSDGILTSLVYETLLVCLPEKENAGRGLVDLGCDWWTDGLSVAY